jgi:hypothetical protein
MIADQNQILAIPIPAMTRDHGDVGDSQVDPISPAIYILGLLMRERGHS